MTRCRTIALIILLLVVATVVIAGPVRVWGWMTTKTVEEYYDSGTLRFRVWVRLWETRPSGSLEWWVISRGEYDEWYENGQKQTEVRSAPVARTRSWSENGQLVGNTVAGTGIVTILIAGDTYEQTRWEAGKIVETRESPPWFTEEEILQSVDGVEE